MEPESFILIFIVIFFIFIRRFSRAFASLDDGSVLVTGVFVPNFL